MLVAGGQQFDPQPALDRQERAPQLLAPGEVIDGDYQVETLLGIGAMGEVYRAHDLQLDRPVAIKVCRPGIDPGWVRNEGRSLARLRHRGIVGVHGLGVWGDHSYLVMELLQGETLRQQMCRAPDRRLAIGTAVDALIELAEALSAVHGAGLVHRDIKPDNVIVERDRSVLIDFGVCICRYRLARLKGMAGSPHYLAPEIPLGTVTPERAHLVDLYALGITAFELLTGQVPFDHQSMTRLASLHAAVDAPRLSELLPLPAQLDELVSALLRKDAAERPLSASSVVSWLRRVRRSLQDSRAAVPGGDLPKARSERAAFDDPTVPRSNIDGPNDT